MDKDKYYKLMFLVAAIWTLGVSAPLFFVSLVTTDFMILMGITPPSSLIFFHSMIAMVVSYGIGYVFISRNPDENRVMVFSGAIAKVLFFIITLVYALLGQSNFLPLLLGIGDLVFALLFLEFLIKL